MNGMLYTVETEEVNHNFVSNVVYSMHGGNVDTVICNGKIIMQEKELVNVDEEAVLEKAGEIAHKMVSG